MKVCQCGCGRDISHLKRGAIFSHEHTPGERVKLRYQHYRELAQSGMLPADNWHRCVICGEWFPRHNKIHGKTREIFTCPDFINPECTPVYRGQRRAGKPGRRPETYRSLENGKQKEFRFTICHRHGTACSNYSRCSDREFNKEHNDRLWKYELHGVDCYEHPATESNRLTSVMGHGTFRLSTGISL